MVKSWILDLAGTAQTELPGPAEAQTVPQTLFRTRVGHKTPFFPPKTKLDLGFSPSRMDFSSPALLGAVPGVSGSFPAFGIPSPLAFPTEE